MTQKDYIKIAATLKDIQQEIDWQIPNMVEKFALMLKADNPRFDRAKFLRAVYKN